MPKIKFIISIGLLALVSAGWIIIGSQPGEVQFLSVNDLLKHQDRFFQKQVRLGGNVKTGSIKYSGNRLDLYFDLKQGEAILPVVHHSAAVPDLFREGAQVIIEGIYEKGVFRADNLMTKCASRYEEESEYVPVDKRSI